MFSGAFWAVKCITVTENTQRDYIKLTTSNVSLHTYKTALFWGNSGVFGVWIFELEDNNEDAYLYY